MARRSGWCLPWRSRPPVAALAIQKHYVRRVVDAVNDLDNVLYEIVNESGSFSTEWQYHMINVVQRYETHEGKQHPVGMTYQNPHGVCGDPHFPWKAPVVAYLRAA